MDDYKGSLFKRDMEDYHTELNPIAGYVKQASKFLEVTFGYTPEEARKKKKKPTKKKKKEKKKNTQNFPTQKKKYTWFLCIFFFLMWEY